MKIKIRLAVRDWDYIVPLALGDVTAPGIDLDVHRVGTLPDDLASDPRFDAGEMSMSRYSLGRARGRQDIVGVPHFLMRGFRHRSSSPRGPAASPGWTSWPARASA